MLVLFDIDGTLVLSHGASLICVRAAAQEMFGVEFQAQGSFAGMLDPLIFRELCQRHGIPDADEHQDRFRATYGRLLEQRLQQGPGSYALPGVAPLLAELSARPALTLGLLTGNYPETGRMKLRSAGLDDSIFRVAAWGCDAGSRRDLVPVAMARHGPVPAEEVVIIGDTPHDVDCARAHGCRSLAVSTGSHGMEELARCGANLVVPDLSDTPRMVEWILDAEA